MTYSFESGIKQEGRNKFTLAAALTAIVSVFILATAVSPANAASGPVAYTTTPFTPAEVALWTPDRTAPTGGHNSTTFGGRDNVLEMRLDGESRSTIPFHQTEGLQRDIPDSDSIKADIYIDAAWGSQTVRAGIWGVAQDETQAISAYPIIEYSTDPTNAPGWRYWDVYKWVALPGVAINPGWNTLSITLDDAVDMFIYRVNGVQVASMDGEGSSTIASAILNSKNYGEDYAAHWSNFAYGNVLATAVSKDDCKNGGWQTLFDKNGKSFKNQGQCVSSVANNKNNQ